MNIISEENQRIRAELYIEDKRVASTWASDERIDERNHGSMLVVVVCHTRENVTVRSKGFGSVQGGKSSQFTGYLLDRYY